MLGSLLIIFARIGRAIYAQTMVELTVFGCNNKSSNPGVEGSVALDMPLLIFIIIFFQFIHEIRQRINRSRTHKLSRDSSEDQ